MEQQSFTIDDISRKRARHPHELIMLNLAIFHLLLAVGLIAMDWSTRTVDTGIFLGAGIWIYLLARKTV